MYRRAALKTTPLRRCQRKAPNSIVAYLSTSARARCDEVIGSDIENIQLGSYATRSDAKGIQLGVSYS